MSAQKQTWEFSASPRELQFLLIGAWIGVLLWSNFDSLEAKKLFFTLHGMAFGALCLVRIFQSKD